MARAYLGLGSNIGNRLEHLEFGLRELARCGSVLARSPVIETAAVDCLGGAAFLNACVCLDTALDPNALLATALRIESARGRRRRSRNEPRVLDIDLLLVDDMVVREPGLTLPHPRMQDRRFVLEPLAAVAPGVVHPLLGLDVRQLLGRLHEGTGSMSAEPTSRS